MIDTNPLKIGSFVNKHLRTLYQEEANTFYRYSDTESLLSNPKEILKMVKHHDEYQVPRLQVLQRYYIAQNVGIMTRKPRKNPEKSDVRNASGFAKYITDYYVGYMFGQPANIEHEDQEVNESMKIFNRENDVDTLNSDLETSLSKYGRAYETQYRNNDDVDVVKELSVYNTFMVYDTSIEQEEIAGVYYVKSGSKYDIQVHTADEIIEYYTPEKDYENLILRDRDYHDYEEINITEYINDADRLGDYEVVIPTIDTYDYSQSDLANYMNDTNESKMVITGAIDPMILEADEKDVAIDNRESDILILPSPLDRDGKPTGTANVHRITREYDAATVNDYRQSLVDDIYQFSSIPNFNSDFFANTSSGVAVLYKIYQSDNKVKKKQHYFERGLRKRYRIWANFKNNQDELKEYNQRGLKITIHSNLPTSYRDEIEAHIKAGGTLSLKTLLEQLSFIPNVDEEIKRQFEEELEHRGALNLDPDWKNLDEKSKELLKKINEEDEAGES